MILSDLYARFQGQITRKWYNTSQMVQAIATMADW